MLKELGFAGLEDLMDAAVPGGIRADGLDLPVYATEPVTKKKKKKNPRVSLPAAPARAATWGSAAASERGSQLPLHLPARRQFGAFTLAGQAQRLRISKEGSRASSSVTPRALVDASRSHRQRPSSVTSGVAPLPDPMDFSAWFQVKRGGGWDTFDARHNPPRIGRIRRPPAGTPPTLRSLPMMDPRRLKSSK